MMNHSTLTAWMRKIWVKVTTMGKILSLSKNGADHYKTTRWTKQMVSVTKMRKTNSGYHEYARITLEAREVVQVSLGHQGSNEDNINSYT